MKKKVPAFSEDGKSRGRYLDSEGAKDKESNGMKREREREREMKTNEHGS
jgi:hypothetical protein